MKIFMALFLPIMAMAGPLKDESCPVLTLKSPDECFGHVSECWSPGEPDIDCPNRGICCFNGCVNVCGIPTVQEPPTEAPPTCITDYVTQTEDVSEEMCTDVPGVETCVTTDTQECHQVCEVVDNPAHVPEVTTCCRKVQNLVCNEVPCDPTETFDVEVEVDVQTCKRRERYCQNVPEQVCHSEDVQECKPVTVQKCETVKKPTEWPTTTQDCTTKYVEKCGIVHRQFCGHLDHLYAGKKFHHSFKKVHKLSKDGDCVMKAVKECNKQPYTECKPVTTITIEYVNEEVCKDITETACTTKTVEKCQYVDREECVEAEDICKTEKSSKVVQVNKDCSVPEQDCSFVEEEHCEDATEDVEKWVPAKVCKEVCEPTTSKDCRISETTKECRDVVKTMSYEVPIQKCS